MIVAHACAFVTSIRKKELWYGDLSLSVDDHYILGLTIFQPYFPDIPILVMYPGTFDGHHVKLFNRLQPNDYYRAFKVI